MSGYVSMKDKFEAFMFTSIPDKTVLLAPYFAFQDYSCGSEVFYHQYDCHSRRPMDRKMCAQARQDVLLNDADVNPAFNPKQVVVITWHDMMPFPCQLMPFINPDLEVSLTCTFLYVIIYCDFCCLWSRSK